jgi:hypothetical protein
MSLHNLLQACGRTPIAARAWTTLCFLLLVMCGMAQEAPVPPAASVDAPDAQRPVVGTTTTPGEAGVAPAALPLPPRDRGVRTRRTAGAGDTRSKQGAVPAAPEPEARPVAAPPAVTPNPAVVQP